MKALQSKKTIHTFETDCGTVRYDTAYPTTVPFMIDIEEGEEMLESWIYLKGYGYKSFDCGVSKKDFTVEELAQSTLSDMENGILTDLYLEELDAISGIC